MDKMLRRLCLTLVACAGLCAGAELVNVAAATQGATVRGPVNCSGSRGAAPAAIDGMVTRYGRSVGYMWAYLETPMMIRLNRPTTIDAVDLLLLDVDSRDYGYVIETSEDGGAWDVAVDRSGARDRGWQHHRFTAREAAWIRVRFTRTSLRTKSYHVVEIAAYQRSEEARPSPLYAAWKQWKRRQRTEDACLLGVQEAQDVVRDPAFRDALRYLTQDRVIQRDLDGDGDPDGLAYRRHGHTIIALDDNDTMTVGDKALDGIDDCLAVDLNSDGTLDRSVDMRDTDGNGLADTMILTAVSGSPWGRRSLVIVKDYDQLGPKRLWHLTRDYGYNQGQCQWHCDFGGDGFFCIFRRDARTSQWVGAWENPFCFYDPDNDGKAEETVRISGTGNRLRSVRYGINADNDGAAGEDYDYDLSVTALGSVRAPVDALTSLELRSGERSGPFLRWDRTREAVRALPWDRALMVWDEIDHNVAVPRRGRAPQHERWEGVINAAYRGFPQEGGPHCGTVNKRYELDADFSGRMKLYYWHLDRRLHLYGAEQGTLTIDYDLDGNVDITIEYRDTDDDGYFDRRNVGFTDPALGRCDIVPEPVAGNTLLPCQYEHLHAFWKPSLEQTLADQKLLLDAVATLRGEPVLKNGPLHTYRHADENATPVLTRLRASREARRFFQDAEIALAFATWRTGEAGGSRIRRADELAGQGRFAQAADVLRGNADPVGGNLRPVPATAKEKTR